MRYDDFDDYSSRSSRSSRGSSRSGSGRDYDRGYSSRDYDRSYSDRSYDRGYSDRGYSDSRYGRDGYDDFDRGYSRDYDRRSSDRYGSDRRDRYDDFDRRSWERTAPKWDERGSSRSSSSDRRDRDRRSDYDRPRSDRDRRSSGTRSSGSGRSSERSRTSDRRSGGRGDSRGRSGSGYGRSSGKREIPLLPIAIAVVVVVVAIIIVSSLLGGGDSGYEIEFAADTIVAGEATTATIKGLSEGEDYEVVWFSNDSAVAEVDGEGTTATITAKSVGTVSVGVTINGEENINGTLMVVDTAPGVVKITLNQEKVEIYAGETYPAQATVLMESADMATAKVSWESNDPSIARVDANGLITAREVGVAIIKASAGKQTAEMAVTVVANPNNTNHDASASTGTEPEEGAELPENLTDDEATAGSEDGDNGDTGTTE